MATTQEIQTALANEARRQELKQKAAKEQGSVDATASLIQRLSMLNNDAQIALSNTRAELTALEQGAGPGVTADYGPKSTVSQLLETERFAAKEAVVDYVKANPECTEADANVAWETAAVATHPAFPLVLQPGLVFSALYRANLRAAGLIMEDSWEAHRQWILNTPKAVILTL